MNKREIEVAKANIEAAGQVPIVLVCMDCGVECLPEQRKYHGYCEPCGKRIHERFELCLDTQDIR